MSTPLLARPVGAAFVRCGLLALLLPLTVRPAAPTPSAHGLPVSVLGWERSDGRTGGAAPLAESWTPVPGGLEQTWTLASPPPGAGALTIRLASAHPAEVSPDGRVARLEGDASWRYADPRAWDADGRDLSARLTATADPHRFGVTVDDRGARYPIVIDPVLSSSAATFRGATAGDHTGVAVSSAGDVDGDGYGDVLVCGYGDGGDAGTVTVYGGTSSGISTVALATLAAPEDSRYFGLVCDGAGDVNGDGYDDLVVGAQLGSEEYGAAYIYYGSGSGPADAPDVTLTGPDIGSLYGAAVAGVGDLNGDGYADVAVGAPEADSTGRVDVYWGSSSGIRASSVQTWTGEGGEYGYAITGGDDFNADGSPDFAVGAYALNDGTGAVYVYRGGSTVSEDPYETLVGTDASGYFGVRLAGGGDVNGDGSAELLVGASRADSNRGRVYLHWGSLLGLSTTTPTTLSGGGASDHFGAGPAGVGDVNGDGYADIAIGAYGAATGAGRVYVYEGTPDGLYPLPVTTLNGFTGAHFGAAVAGAGDVNGDGFADMLVGAPSDTSSTGRADLYTGYGDTDNDGVSGPSDCDDHDPDRFGGATETPNDGTDSDCDGQELCYPDADNDGYPGAGTVGSTDFSCTARGYTRSSGPLDCDDSEGRAHPGGTEVLADGVDNDCDGTETCYVDGDSDYYRTDRTVESSDGDCADPGEALVSAPADDCDDASAATNPGAPEVPGDGIDENCDGTERCLVDLDGDTYAGETSIESADMDCTDPGEIGTDGLIGDCDDADPDIHPGVTEVVDDHIDQDCDGGDLCYADADNDHHRTDELTTSADLDCGDSGESVATVPSDDCDDSDPHAYPGAPETVGDEVDEDCDGSEVCYVDGDADGYHTNATQASNDATCQSDGLAADSSPGGDCDDGNPAVYPGAEDTLGDDVDQNCDGGDGTAEGGKGGTCGCASDGAGTSGAALLALFGVALVSRRRKT